MVPGFHESDNEIVELRKVLEIGRNYNTVAADFEF